MDLNDMAEATDSAPAPSNNEGYVAEYHPLLKGLGILVFGPCGCRLMLGTNGEGLYTQCQRAECDFSNADAQRAVEALKAATGNKRAYAIVKSEVKDAVR